MAGTMWFVSQWGKSRRRIKLWCLCKPPPQARRIYVTGRENAPSHRESSAGEEGNVWHSAYHSFLLSTPLLLQLAPAVSPVTVLNLKCVVPLPLVRPDLVSVLTAVSLFLPLSLSQLPFPLLCVSIGRPTLFPWQQLHPEKQLSLLHLHGWRLYCLLGDDKGQTHALV